MFWGGGGELPPLGASVNNVLAYSIRECASIVNGRGRFYIGVTMDPFWRFFGDADWKHHHNWKWMHILAVSTAPGIKRLERLILANPRVGLAQYLIRTWAKEAKVRPPTSPSMPRSFDM